MRLNTIATAVSTDLAKVYHVPKGETRDDEHLIYHGAAIIDSSTSVGTGITLNPGDTIDASAAAADKMVLTLYGTTATIIGPDSI